MDHQIYCIIAGIEEDYERLLSYSDKYFIGRARKIFQAFLALHRANPPVTEDFLLSNLEESLVSYYEKQKEKYDPLKKDEYFSKLDETHNSHQLRQLGIELRKNDTTVSEKISLIDTTLRSLENKEDPYVFHAGTIAEKVLKQVETGKPPCVPYYLDGLDSILTGMFKTECICIGGRSSMGKTALAIQIHINLSVEHKIPTGFISVEMSPEQITPRLLCNIAGVSMKKWQSFNYTQKEIKAIKKAIRILKDSPLYIVDITRPNVYSVVREIRRLVTQYKIEMASIDYIQLLAKSDNKHSEISTNSKIIKETAKECKIPIITLSQISRSAERESKNKKPELIHLKESGSIEEDSDVVMLMYRPSYYDQSIKANESEGITDPKSKELQIEIAKHRNGPTGIVKCIFDRELQRIF